MFKINNRRVKNKLTVEKFGPEKIIVQYLIRIVHRGNLVGKKKKPNSPFCITLRMSRRVQAYPINPLNANPTKWSNTLKPQSA